VAEWAADRRVGGQADVLYWYVVARCCPGCRREACCCPRVDSKPVHGPHTHYRQHKRLTADEAAFWNGLCECLQARYAFPSLDKS
jgi:hypothetical protein